MGPSEAIRSGLACSLNYSGRASRSEFWWFAPVGLVIAVIGCNAGAMFLDDRQPISFLVMAIVTFLSFIPLTSAGSRRLQDTGEHGQDILLPIMPIIFVLLYLSVIVHGAAGVLVAYFTFPALGFVAHALLLLISVGIFVLAPLAGLFFLGPVIGQLLVPSEPGPNRFGPNPNEVSS